MAIDWKAKRANELGRQIYESPFGDELIAEYNKLIEEKVKETQTTITKMMFKPKVFGQDSSVGFGGDNELIPLRPEENPDLKKGRSKRKTSRAELGNMSWSTTQSNFEPPSFTKMEALGAMITDDDDNLIRALDILYPKQEEEDK